MRRRLDEPPESESKFTQLSHASLSLSISLWWLGTLVRRMEGCGRKFSHLPLCSSSVLIRPCIPPRGSHVIADASFNPITVVMPVFFFLFFFLKRGILSQLPLGVIKLVMVMFRIPNPLQADMHQHFRICFHYQVIFMVGCFLFKYYYYYYH